MQTVKLTVAIVLMATLTGCGGAGGSSSPEEPAVKSCFANYKKAITSSNGDAAAAEVDANTISYYSRMLTHTLELSADQTKALGLMDKLIVLMARHRIPADELRAMDGKAFFVYAVDHGWTGDVGNIQLGAVSVTGNTAKAEHLLGNQKSGIYWGFNKEGGKWKIDLTSNMTELQKILKQTIAQQGMGDDEFLFIAITEGNPDQIKDTIWNPVGKGN